MTSSRLRFFGAVAVTALTLSAAANAAAPTGRYVVTNDGTSSGTVYDTKTKLTWQQTVTSTAYTWANAKTYCTGVGTSLGGTGWRLPTLKELQTIIDFSQASPSIDSTAFPSTPPSIFWSASLLTGSTSYAWYVDFSAGNSWNDGNIGAATFRVRCVR